ncbi:ribosomal protein S18 acetylase RimI-like enzyme [Pullulanibacillus pueri]|uniref:N-acetyltransferase domain-containing protein n=1 Tax=Pullulanibacillus pueri TaxID=1437324 RepID=A0A8J2ZXM7_9BACL|nr:GNAT family N-acetyltransferase [Pullulanibacillus pueri]MBM7682954.1 ribosomal protein S18 acetylase RimI-like enzyme [Pullulanibacillus pueri]GGH84686.1 hypothetical protein GCM10007096_28340 [Pullulanibacillus pueri]
MQASDSIKIIPMQQKHIVDINKTNEPFTVFGRLVPCLHHDIWSYEEELFDTPHDIQFPDDHLNWESYINQEDKVIFMAYLGKACIGQIRLVKQWNKYAYIENIAVCQSHRKSGVGRQLFNKAEEWAKKKQLLGLSLEAQDDNLAACRFYIKNGMVLGGVDTMTHAFNKNIDKALYWYKTF